MAIMKRDINFGLFIIIIAILIGFAGFTTYYNSALKNTTSSYEERIGKLTEVTGIISKAQEGLSAQSRLPKIKLEESETISDKETEIINNYNQLIDELNTIKGEWSNCMAGREDVTGKYTTMKTLKERLEDDKASLESNLASARSELDSAKTLLAASQAQATRLQADYDNMKSSRDFWENKFKDECG